MTLLKKVFDELKATAIAGVDLGSSVLKVVELSRSEDGGVVLRRCSILEVEGNDSVEMLRGLLSAGQVGTRKVAMGVASPELAVRSFQFPPMPQKELGAAVKLEAEQAILAGHAIGDMAVDWHLVPSDSKEFIRGLCAVIPKKVLATRLEMAKSSGLHPVVVDVEGLALWNAYWVLVGKRGPAAQTVLLLNVGARTTNLVIVKGASDLIFMRDFRLGAQALAEGQEKEWVTEVRDSLRYARSKAGSWELGAAHVTGGGSSRVNLAELSRAIGLEAKLWNPLQSLIRQRGSPSVEDAQGPLLTIAIGLALRSSNGKAH